MGKVEVTREGPSGLSWDATGLDPTEDWLPCLHELCTLHRASGDGATRTPELFAVLAARKASRLVVARRGGRVVTYVAVSGTSVREYAGSPEDVAALLRLTFGIIEDLPEHSTDRRGPQQGQFEMAVQTPVADAGSGHRPARPALETRRPYALTYMGMVLILHAPGLFAALDGDAAVERLGDRWRVRHGGTALDLTPGELAKLCFGPERWPGFAPEVFPFTFWQWRFDRV